VLHRRHNQRWIEIIAIQCDEISVAPESLVVSQAPPSQLLVRPHVSHDDDQRKADASKPAML